MLALLAALAIATPETAPPLAALAGVGAAQVRITLNGGDYSPGDEVRVQVEPGADGYLVVFRVDGDGRVRVLFPLDPDLDAYVRGGRRYELRGRGERHTFLADDRGGNGVIYAALSRDRLVFNDYAVNDQWDHEMLRLSDRDDDPERDLNAIVRRMAQGGRFDYDIVGYRVYEPTYAGGGYAGYDPYYDCLACYPFGSRVSVRIGSGYGWYDPYDPWLYGDAGYNYYRYGYRYRPWYPGSYTPYYPYYPNYPIVVYPHRPRQVTPESPYGYRARPPQGLAGVPASFTPDLGRNVRPSPRPVVGESHDGRSRVRNDPPSQGARQPSGSGRNAERTEQPRRQPESQPGREARPAERPTTSPAPTRGGTETRSRRPNGLELAPSNSGGEERPVFLGPSRTEPSRGREVSPPREQPVYREPPRTERSPQREPQREPQRAERPPQRESAPPQRVERPAPQRESPPPRVERPAPSREAPPPSREAPSSGRSRGRN